MDAESANVNHCFQPLAPGDFLKLGGDIIQGKPMRNPGRCINPALFHHADKARKVAGAIPRREQREFTVVKEGVVDGHRSLHDPNPYHATAEPCPRNALRHRSGITRGINHRIGQPAVGFGKGFDAKALHSCAPSGLGFDDAHSRSHRQGKLSDRHTDWARADDQDKFAWGCPRPHYRVGPNAQRFDQRQLVEGETRGGVDMIQRHNQVLSHSPIFMHAEDPDVLAIVVVTRVARITLAAIQVGFDGTTGPRRQATVVGWNIHHLRTEFVPQHPGIGEECLPAIEGVKVRAAEAHAVNSQERLARARSGWSSMGRDQAVRSFECDLLHEGILGSEIPASSLG